MKIAFVLMGSLLVLSCAHINQPQEYSVGYRESLIAGKCEEASKYVPLEMEDYKFSRFYRGTIGNIAYFASLPVTIGLDWIAIFRCGYGAINCPYNSEKTPAENMGMISAHSYEFTKELRCPDTRYYVQKYLEISECFERRGDRKSLTKALEPLDQIEDRFNSFATCISYQDHFVAQYGRSRVEKKLSKLPP